jgi:bifunctional enzyme CysN/CysC
MPGSLDIVRLLACGSVDDGKSTLIGHLVSLTGNLHDDQLISLQHDSAQAGSTGSRLDYSLLLDGLLAEREQGITIDVAYRHLETQQRKFIVADAPGHESYTRNMATGASHCSAALILVDASKGVLSQTRRHALICVLMGIKNLLFAVNKMDLLNWGQEGFRQVEEQCAALSAALHDFGLPLADHAVVPVSALEGDNLIAASPHMPWYRGVTVLGWLHALKPVADETHFPFRLPVQFVIKAPRGGELWQRGAGEGQRLHASGIFRAYAGIIASGTLKRGDPVAILPSGRQAAIDEIRLGGELVTEASAGMSVSVTVSGEQDIVRGDCLALPSERPETANLFKVRLVWMHEAALFAGRHYLFKSVCGAAGAEITCIRNRIDLQSWQRLSADRLSLNDIGEAELSLSRPVPFDPYHLNRETGGFILIDRLSNATVAAGMILHALRRAENVHWQHHDVGRAERSALKEQKPCVIWLTGLSGSGKSTIANLLECRLSEQRRHTMLLDGDNIRHGLNKDLGFTEAGRIENIRRIGEVAKLMTDAGLIVIAAFISPFRAEREMVRQLLPEGEFIEVHLSTSLQECERRDPKGLYRKARLGEIPNLTGIDSPYQAPENPELRLDTALLSTEACCDAIIDYLESGRRKG